VRYVEVYSIRYRVPRKGIFAGLIEGILGRWEGDGGEETDRVVVNFRRHVKHDGQPKEINCSSSPRFSSGR